MYNYADDNTISEIGDDVKQVKTLLEESTAIARDWFEKNFMQANAEKFQAILLGNCKDKDDITFSVGTVRSNLQEASDFWALISTIICVLVSIFLPYALAQPYN